MKWRALMAALAQPVSWADWAIDAWLEGGAR